MKAFMRWFKREMKRRWWLLAIWWGMEPVKFAIMAWMATQEIHGALIGIVNFVVFFLPTITTVAAYFISKAVEKRR